MDKLSKEVLTRLDIHDPLSAKYVRALQAQLATVREDALREALRATTGMNDYLAIKKLWKAAQDE